MTDGNNHKVIVNLIGTGSKVFRINPSPELLERLKETSLKMKTPLDQAFFDVDFFNRLGDPKHRSFDDLANQKVQGLIQDFKSHIEIRTKGKKKRMISIEQLLNQQSLLPLYNVEFKQEIGSIRNAILVIEKEVGLVSCFQISTEKFDLGKMKFEIVEVETGIEKLQILTGLFYEDEKLDSISDDTLVTSCYSIVKI